MKVEAPKQNILDRALSYFSPEAGFRRFRNRAMMAIAGGYLGARLGRAATKQWFVRDNDADTDILSDLPKLRARSRDLVRNTPLATGAVGTAVQSVVGTGLSLQSRPDAKVLGMTDDEADEWTAQVEAEFRIWSESKSCDLTQTQNFYQLQGLVFRSSLESGDVFSLLLMTGKRFTPYALQLQVVEADRVDNPRGVRDGKRTSKGGKISGGVRFDANGAPVDYHFLDEHPGSVEGRLRKKGKWIPAFGVKTKRRNVLHIFERSRPGQTRGVPYLAPVIEQLKQLDRYTEAEVMAAVVSSLLTVFVKSDSAEGLLSQPDTATSDESKKEIKLETGTIVDLGPGEDITTVSPNRPNTAFDPFVQAAVRQIGASLGIPFEVLVKHFTASFSASRAALLEAWRFFRGRREFLAAEFCQPVYEAWLEEAVARGRIAAPGFFSDPRLRMAYAQADWIGDAPGQIDPVKEANAAKTRLEIGISSRTRETLANSGAEWGDVHREQVREKEARKRDGLESAAPTAPPAALPAEPMPPADPAPDEPQDNGGSDEEKEEQN